MSLHTRNERKRERGRETETDARLWCAQTETQHKTLPKVTPLAREEEHGQKSAAASMTAALYSWFLVQAGSKQNGPSTLLGGIFLVRTHQKKPAPALDRHPIAYSPGFDSDKLPKRSGLRWMVSQSMSHDCTWQGERASSRQGEENREKKEKRKKTHFSKTWPHR